MAPERELIRRISPFALPVAILAFVVGALLGGTNAGWSAAIAIAVVYANFVAHGWSIALAATVSPVAAAERSVRLRSPAPLLPLWPFGTA